ncbi:MAG: hypothetical protein M3P51_12745 [Chloroflexota bacterium]|nr:hypothetical protein [Chloroflexota bacterium]
MGNALTVYERHAWRDEASRSGLLAWIARKELDVQVADRSIAYCAQWSYPGSVDK